MSADPPCSACGQPLRHNPRRKGTQCRSCFARAMSQSPDKREKCRNTMKARFAQPGYAELHTKRCGEGTRKAMERPEFVAMRREQGRQCGLLGLGHNRKGPGTPERRAAGRKRHETVMAWCPPEYRPEHHRLVRSKLIPSAEAQRIILQQIDDDIARYHRGLLSQAEFVKVRAAMRYLVALDRKQAA